MTEEKKEAKSFSQIKEEFDKIEKVDKKIEFLKKELETDEKNQRKIQTLLGKTLLTKKAVVQYTLVYDSLSEGLEPVYFWLLDFMQDKGPGGQGMSVKKGAEQFEASASSGYFGELGQRATLMQKQAMEYLGAINQVIKSIIQLIYDLKEFEIRLKMYDDLKLDNEETRRAASYALKGVWMDQVDIRKGKGSINMLVQDLSFVTLRDAFFVINEISLYEIKDEKKRQEEILKEVKNLDLNERVKNVLAKKVYEYLQWKSLSEKEIRNRFNVEKAYLKSQFGTLKLYASWVKPYLLTAQKLKMTEFNTANIIAAFSNMEMHLSLIGKREVSANSAESKLPANYKFIEKDIQKYYYVLMVDMIFRSVPSAVQGQSGRHYVHSGRTDIEFKSFVMTKEEADALDAMELYEDLDLVEDWVQNSLDAVKEDLDHFLEDKKPPVDSKENKEDKKKKKKKLLEGFDNPFSGVLKGGGSSLLGPAKEFFKSTPPSEIYSKIVEAEAKEKAEKSCFLVYNLYKKSHGMLST